MADFGNQDILKQESIFGYLGQLLRDVSAIKKEMRTKDREEDLGDSEDAQDASIHFNPFIFHAVRVSSVEPDGTKFYAQRTRPDPSTPWVVDADFASQFLTIDVPEGINAPSDGQIVSAFFTGTYQNTAATSPTPQARYGLFGAGGGSETHECRIDSLGEDVLYCTILISSIASGDSIVVAKPYKLRKSPWDGQTVNGLTYVYAINTPSQRTAQTVSGAARTVNHRIIPRYNADSEPSTSRADIILAHKVSDSIYVTDQSTPVEWIDMNVDGRVWGVTNP